RRTPTSPCSRGPAARPRAPGSPASPSPSDAGCASEGCQRRPGQPILSSREGAALKDAAEVWEFVRRDPVGRWVGIAWAVIAWFALTWLSLAVTMLLVLMSVVLVVLQRRRRELLLLDDDLDDLI